ncbi:MAG: HAD family phosphatase [Actinobacteria bacterium]|nr:HAD family phosphatase [Actinomycetota bacterium]
MPTEGFFSAVLFDMDGTLVNTEPLWLLSEQDLTGRYGYSWTSDDQARCLGGPLDRVGRYMHEKTNAESPEFFTNTLIDLMVERLHQGAPLMPGSEVLMELLTSMNIPMALVSASPRVLVDAVLENLASHPFQFSISSDDVAKVKPHPEGYLKAAEFLGAGISNTLILEDSDTGVTAARESGGWVIAIPHLVHIESVGRVKTYESLEALNENELLSHYRNCMAN